MKMVSIGEFGYKTPLSLQETLVELRNGSRVLAGGTDLIVQMKYGQVKPSMVVDLKKIPELNVLEWTEEGGLYIGAAVPLSKVLKFRPLWERFGVLAQACSVIGSTQIKNRATIGGNICNAAPSADSAPALLCLDAKAIIASTQGKKTIPLQDFFLAPGQTKLEDNELLVQIEVGTPPANSAGCYLRHTTREEMDIAVAGVASLIIISPEDRKIQQARIAMGAVAATPIRARQAETFLMNKSITRATIEEAAEKAAIEAKPISDIRGSAEYRLELVKVLTRRTLKTALERLNINI